ncbi:flavin reductase (DIM6/NTAB) family NADH-FMN oxidoreductase RutF [Oxalobacteraceae bacterium GrIS 1.11]
MYFDPLQIDAQSCYHLLVGAVVPRPIAWISTIGADGVANLAPYSFFTVASCAPPVLCVTEVKPRHRPAKDTLSNLRSGSDCVVNIVSAALAETMNATCADYAPQVSEFAALGVAAAASLHVRAAGVAAALVRFECTLRDIVTISPLPTGGTLMLLDVVAIYVNEHVMVDGKISPARLDAIGKLGGDWYSNTRERFALPRPTLASESLK